MTEYELKLAVYEYEQYFADDFARLEESELFDYASLELGYTVEGLSVGVEVLEDGKEGVYYPAENRLVIDREHCEKPVILHELTHYFIEQLYKSIPHFSEWLTIELYKKLSCVKDLDKWIFSHLEHNELYRETSKYGLHSILFLLKTLDLDLRCGYKLGTVCGYGREDWGDKMTSDNFVVQGNVGGYYDENGHFVVCEEYGLTDADADKYAVEVQNGDGFYSSDGHFVRIDKNS